MNRSEKNEARFMMNKLLEAEMVARQFKKFGGKLLSLEITSISNIKFPMELAGGFGNASL